MDYQNKRIAILGYGVEGKSAYAYFKKQGAILTIHDSNPDIDIPPGTGSVLGEAYLENLGKYDLVVRSPGVLPNTFNTTTPVTSVMNEFLQRCPAPVIGITGSKGKGTAATLIYEILKSAIRLGSPSMTGKTAWLGGNIGTPPLDFLDKVTPDDYVVLEMSNLQLWDIKASPQIAVLLMITPEHLDWHKGINEYMATKANITRFQGDDDMLVYLGTNEYVAQIAAKSKARKLPFMDKRGVWVDPVRNRPAEGTATTALGRSVSNGVDGENIKFQDIIICKTTDVQLLGAHNLENVCAAIAATWEIVKDKEAVRRAIRDFKGLPHRLEFIAEINGVKYYNDSIGTTPEAAIAAIKSFERPKVLIMGGSDKGSVFDGMAAEIVNGNVKAVILMGDTALAITRALQKAGYPPDNIVTLSEQQRTEGSLIQTVVQKASSLAVTGDVVLLAPACASFGLFNNYQDRGDQFKQAVQKLK